MMVKMNYLIEMWQDVLIGKQSNWEFFTAINSGWLEMECQHRYGNNPTEEQQWEWMWMNVETIKLSSEDYDAVMLRLGLMDDV